MKLKQHLIIKQYFIDYSLGVYSKDLKPTVSGNAARILEQDNYENVLDITKLVTKDDGDIGVIFESPDLVTEEQVYTLNVVNNQFIFNGKYIEANSYPSVEDIPMETNNALVAIDKDGKKDLVLLVDREFAKLSEEEQKTTLLNIFKQQVRIDFDTPEEIAGVKFDLNDSVWKAKDNKLNIHSAVIKGDIEVYNDDRRYDLLNVHIGKLGLTDKEEEDTYGKPFVLYRLYGEEVPVTEVREFQTKEDFFKEVALRSAFTHQDASQISYLKLGLVKSEYIEDGWLVAPMTSGKLREWQRGSAVGTFAPNAYLRIGELPDPKHPLLKDYNLVGVMFGGGAFSIQHDIVFPDWVITGESMFERARGIPEGSEYYSSDFRPFTLEDVDLSNLKSAPKMFKDFEDWGYSPSFYAELPFIPDSTRDVEVIENAKFYRRDYKGEEMTETIKPFSLMPKRNGHCEIGVDYEPYIALITSRETDEEHYIETIKEFQTKEEFFNYTPLPGEERLVGLVKSEYIEDGWLLAPINDDPDTEIQFGSGYNPKLADYNLVGLMLARTNSRPYWSLPEWVITGESMFENKEDTEHHSYSLDGGGNIETIPKMFKNYKGVVDEYGDSVNFSILVDSEEINAEEVNEGALVWSGMTPHSLEYRVTRTETESGKDRYHHQILIGPGGA